MGFPKNEQQGGRGCPSCGSHDTKATTRVAGNRQQICATCGNMWEACSFHCRGYHVFAKPTPSVKGCQLCGVPDAIAQKWPEPYRRLANVVAGTYPKLDSVEGVHLRAQVHK